MIASDPAIQGSQLGREVAYYRREVNELGAQVIRLHEEQQRMFLEVQRSRLVTKLVRALYRASDLDAPFGTLPRRVLEVVVEHAMCSCAALLRERQLGTGVFAVLGQIGVILADQPLRLRRVPPFLFTTGSTKLDPPASEIATWLGVPYVLWTYDPGSGCALLLGNKNEGNAARPFEADDQELIETGLTVFLDAWARSARPAMATPDHGGADQDDATEDGQQGLEGGDVLQQQLRRGGRVLGVVIVERGSAESCEYAAYLSVSWERGWRILRTYRDRDDRTYRDFDRLLQYVRSELAFTGSVTVCRTDTGDIERFPMIAARERLRRQIGNPPVGMSLASSVMVDESLTADARRRQARVADGV